MKLYNFFTIAEENMKKTVNKFKVELASIRTGRASVPIVGNIKVKSYDSILTISQISKISLLDAKTIEVRPWDVSQIDIIEKAILKADIGLVPVNYKKFIRISVLPLTEDRRKYVCGSINKMSEEFKITIRNERRILLDNIKKLEKNKVITEDDKKNLEIKAQKITDAYIKNINESVIAKEHEIMQI
ncbi:MAG: ribosome recycling factor [Endomicrobium sp.]|jgi:ribosome recycling factor|nr:ribosome recycling factor [Endomicrobium sp.]